MPRLFMFDLDDGGVDLVHDPLHSPGLTAAQNVAFLKNQAQGGIGTRGGLAALTTSAMSGGVLGVGVVPIAYPGTRRLMLGLNTGEAGQWKYTNDGTTFAALTANNLRMTGIDKNPLSGTVGLASMYAAQRTATYLGVNYFPNDAYTQYPTGGFGPPVINMWNTFDAVFTQLSVPTNPTATAGSTTLWVADMLVANGVIYLAVYDDGGAGVNLKGRVLSYDPVTGECFELGNRFGNGTGENTNGFPLCLAWYQNRLWAGTWGGTAVSLGKVYSIRPGVEETWTLELTGTNHNGYYMSLCQYGANLYAATDADAGGPGTSIIQQRTATGTWSTSFTAPANGISYLSGLIVFNSLLFACYYKSATGVVLIKKYDGTTWTTDLDVAGTYAAKPPGAPMVYQNALYWPFLGSETLATSTAGFLLKRTTGAVWSRQVNATGIRGLGHYTPPG